MGHFTQHTAVRAGDALNAAVGTVHIPLFILTQFAVAGGVPGSYLTICHQFRQPLGICNKPSLAVGGRVYIDSSKFCLGKPRRLVGHNLCIDHLGNMTSNGIEGQCR